MTPPPVDLFEESLGCRGRSRAGTWPRNADGDGASVGCDVRHGGRDMLHAVLLTAGPVGGITVCGTDKRLPLRSLIGACRRLALSMVRAVPVVCAGSRRTQWTSLREISGARTRLRYRCIGGRSTMADLTGV